MMRVFGRLRGYHVIDERIDQAGPTGAPDLLHLAWDVCCDYDPSLLDTLSLERMIEMARKSATIT